MTTSHTTDATSNSGRITDVALRDGLQNEAVTVSTPAKLELFDALASAGVDEIELTSMVRADLVPQLADAPTLVRDAAAAFARLPEPRPVCSVLVPNRKGLERLMQIQREIVDAGGEAPVSKIAVFTAASQTFSQRNTNATIEQTLERFGELMPAALDAGLRVRGYVSCIVRCPYEGPIDPMQVARVAAALVQLGVHEIDLGDTIGAGTPETIATAIDRVRHEIHQVHPGWGDDPMRLTLHLHQPSGDLGAIIDAAVAAGIRSFDASSGGLGGCPFASTPDRRAPGNISTIDLAGHLRRNGLSTRVSDEQLAHAAAVARSCITADGATLP